MVLSATVKRYVPPFIGSRIASFIASKNTPKLVNLFKRSYFSSSAPQRPTHFQSITHPRQFSTETTGLEKLRNRLLANPEKLNTDSLKKTDVDNLITLIEEGVVVDKIVLSKRNLDLASVERILTAIGKQQPYLPAFRGTNPHAMFHDIKVFFKPDLSTLKQMESDLNAKPYKIWNYEMQNISLKDEESVKALSQHIVNLYDKNIVVITLNPKDSSICKPRINAATGHIDMNPVTVTHDAQIAKLREMSQHKKLELD